MKLIHYILASVGLTVLASCEKEIDFEYKDIPEQQVIEGLLTQDGVSVRLTKTVPTDEPFNDNTVTDATVTVVDKTAGERYSLTLDENGQFSHPDLREKSDTNMNFPLVSVMTAIPPQAVCFLYRR